METSLTRNFFFLLSTALYLPVSFQQWKPCSKKGQIAHLGEKVGDKDVNCKERGPVLPSSQTLGTGIKPTRQKVVSLGEKRELCGVPGDHKQVDSSHLSGAQAALGLHRRSQVVPPSALILGSFVFSKCGKVVFLFIDVMNLVGICY